MAVDTNFGTFKDERYQIRVGAGQVGAVMSLEFTPSVSKCKRIAGADGQDWTIHLIQIVHEIPDPNPATGVAAQGNAGYAARVAANGWAVDMEWQAPCDDGYQKIAAARLTALQGQNAPASFTWQLAVDNYKKTHKLAGNALTSLDPRYAQQRIAADIPLYIEQGGMGTNGSALILETGKSYKPAGPLGTRSVAVLRDNPGTPRTAAVLGMQFQVAALMEYGAGQHSYLGSVSWGYQRSSGQNDVQLIPLAQQTANGVSADYTTAVTHWSALTVPDPVNLSQQALPAPMPVMQIPVN
jgi:hypothetical protein